MAAPGETATDPICGMQVEITTARYTHDYDGATYYFCCAGCQGRFAKDPEAYVKTP
jgi:YHS domain-containing protein